MHEVTTERTFSVLRMLASRRYGMSVGQIARELAVNDRTIRRDLKRLEYIGFLIEVAEEARGRKVWKLSRTDGCPGLQFSFDEAVALSLVRPLLEPFCGTELWLAADQALRKIRGTLSEKALAHFESLYRVFHFTGHGSLGYHSKAEIINELTLAIEDSKVVHLTYRSQGATEPARRELHPYKLLSHKSSLYLLAFAPDHGEVRCYKVDRMEQISTSSAAFARPKDFDVSKYLAGSFGIYDGDESVTVVVKILPSAVRGFRESKVRPHCEMTDQPDGSLVARFELTSTVEIKSWILSFGAAAEILEPETLRQSVASELEQLLKAYRPRAQTRRKPASHTSPKRKRGIR